MPVRGLIVVPSRGVAQNVQTNNAWVSFINHDGRSIPRGGLASRIPATSATT